MPTRAPIRSAGPPKLGPQKVTPDLPQTADQLWRRLYIRGVDDGLEKLHGFRPGGYHPLHLQDELNGGQYRVIHKLGHGGYATVWLCRDQYSATPSYVAIKILITNKTGEDNCELLKAINLRHEWEDKTTAGTPLCLSLKRFTSQSPNGAHICHVYPMLGPTTRDALGIFSSENGSIEILQRVSRQAVRALAGLHSHGICHGDFRPSNILLELRSLDGLVEEQVLSLLGEPETTDIHIREDSHPTPRIPYAPKYLVYPPDPKDIDHSIILPYAKVIDFGQSFDTSQRAPTSFGIPANYAAPEVALDSCGTVAMDLWSLGCTLFEIRLGRRLFDVFQLAGLRKEDYVEEITYLLGPPPEPWAKYLAESDGEANASGRLLEQSSDNSERQLNRFNSIRKKITNCVDCAGQECAHPRFQFISEAEVANLADLLEKLLRYRPEERLSAQEVLEHKWFYTQYKLGGLP